MNINKNYYQILGLNKNASLDEIKKTYKKLAIKYHPDKNNGDKEKEEKFKEITEAYSELSDPNKKSQYDNQSPHGKTYNPNPFSNLGDIGNIFNSFFGGSPFGSPFGRSYEYKEFHENLDIQVNIILTLADVYKSQPLKVSYKRNIHCEDCDGTGFDRESSSDDCEMCNGSGKNTYGRKCDYCQGTGKVYTKTCKKCNGEKVVYKDTEFNINNIYTIRKSIEEILPGGGHQSKYFREKIGFLKLNVIYQDIKDYSIENDKLYYKLDLHYEDAINGTVHKFELLDNKNILIKIPEKTKDGDIIKIKGKGLLKNPTERDDLYIKINIIIDYEKLK